MHPHEMFEQLMSPDFAGDGRLPNDFLSFLGPRYPPERVVDLLRSSNWHTRAAGAFLATFLKPEVVTGFKFELAALLDEPNSRVRMDAIEALRDCVTPYDGPLLGRLLLLLDSDHPADHYSVTLFIRLVHDGVLKAAATNAAVLRPESAFTQIASDLRNKTYLSRAGIARSLQSEHRAVRRFAAAMAGRARLVINEHLLELVENADDLEVRKMAAISRKHPVPTWAGLSSEL